MKMSKMKLYGFALDYAVAMVEKKLPKISIRQGVLYYRDYNDNITPWCPTCRLDQGMEIAIRRRVMFHPVANGEWACRYKDQVVRHANPLFAAMKAIVQAEIDRDEICIPIEVADEEPAH